MVGSSFNELLEYAIKEEQNAVEFYTELAGKVNQQHVKEMLLELAEQEKGHKTKLEHIRAKGAVASGMPGVVDLKIADYLVEVEPTPDLSFQGALIIAMKREKAAFKMYTDLAQRAVNDDARQVFRFLAQEEANHKLHFEVQYDDLILQEN